MPRAPLEARVASISAEIAAAIAQAQSRVYEDDEDELDDDDRSGSGSGQEMDSPGTIVPNTSGIRGLAETSGVLPEMEEDDDDSDAFPIPLRTRKGKDPVTIAGQKRKR